MYQLQNNELTVDVIDPAVDRHLLGSRYCCGGYIFQIIDHRVGPLLSGPAFPHKPFNTFDGQGIPDVFLTAPGEHTAQVGDDVEVIGVGRVKRTSSVLPFHVRNNPTVTAFTNWNAAAYENSIVMSTEQEFHDWRLLLCRTVILDKRSIRSKTEITNTGSAKYAMRWFPHPFFPFPQNGVACRFAPQIEVPQNSGFFSDEKGFVCLNKNYDWDKGLFQPLNLLQKENLSIEQRHPFISSVNICCDYTPAFLPVWANSQTFSFEPYLEATIQSGDRLEWSVSYCF